MRHNRGLSLLVVLGVVSAPAMTPCPDGPAPLAWERVDVVFVLDTTGSMSGMIEGAKEKIWSIVTAIARSQPAPLLRMGLLAYRDRGDAYVTQSLPLTGDMDVLYERLLGLEAEGGGDLPERVNEALRAAVSEFDWDPGARTLRLAFLVGDAPPHRSRGGGDVPYQTSVARARQRGVRIHALQCGEDGRTEEVWREIAATAGGAYLRLPQSGGARTLRTPYDDLLAKHGALLDETRQPYGDAAAIDQAVARRKRAEGIRTGSSAEALADRAAYLGTGRERAVTGVDLVVDVAAGRVRLEEIPEEQLPEALRRNSPEMRPRYLEQLAAREQGLLEEINYLADARRRFAQESAGASGDGFDARILDLLRCDGLGGQP